MYKIYPEECKQAANTIIKALEGVCSAKAEHIGRLGGIITILQDQTAVLSLIYATWANAEAAETTTGETSNQPTEIK